MDEKEVKKIAELARLELSAEEEKKIPDQLIKVLDYVGQLKELDTENIPPLDQPLGSKMTELVKEEDSECVFDNPEKLTKNAPDFKDGFYRVKKIIE